MPLKKRPTAKNSSPIPPVPRKNTGFWQYHWGRFTRWTVLHHFWQKFAVGTIVFIMLLVGSMYGIAQWYIHKHADTPMQMGATFIPDYARYFDLEPKETLDAMINDLGVKRLRLVSYWDIIEKEQGTYNFEELDWQMKAAEASGVHVALTLGLRQPRWPECHMPSWAEKMTGDSWYPDLYRFIETTVNRYKDSPALESYQLENEFFLKAFGMCTNFDRDRLVHEYQLVKRLDPNHKLVVSMSNNAIGTPIGEPRPDQWAISVYKRVWDKTITRRYFEYPIPAWYYAFRAGFTEITRGRDSFIHELQTEAWVADTYGGIKDASIEEQDKTMSPQRLNDRIEYGRATGMRTVDLWGAEWWYWRKKSLNDPGLWNVAKEQLKKTYADNARLENK